MPPFVPTDFDPPLRLDHPRFLLRPLGPEHNDIDFAAWTGSVEHIRATPGFERSSWPHPMTLDDNRGDLVMHADDFAARRGFTYTVLSADGLRIIGCVYIYPSERPEADARVRSWVRAGDADLDPVVHATVTAWLVDDWPFGAFDYAPRRAGGG